MVRNKSVFALDIGTRKVAGLLVAEEDRGPRVLAFHVEEQAAGAMKDGQIHLVDKVAATIRSVRATIERRAGTRLPSAAVAAAGRSLLTYSAEAERTFAPKRELDAGLVRSLELEAVQKAQEAVVREQLGAAAPGSSGPNYLCVGYSTLACYLDGQPIGGLLGHRASRAKVSVIATFLPRSVVDSLQAALRQASLEVAGMTLEPIAAINVVVPSDMRTLNLALVDVGAGTSDIAITEKGTVTAYGMVPIAGDEITEALGAEYLLDFAEAERVKRYLGSVVGTRPGRGEPARGFPGHTVSFTDVLGVVHELPVGRLLQVVESHVGKLAEAVAAEVLRLNDQRPPQAVMCVGGGSMTPGFTAALAERLGLAVQRVRVRDTSAIKDVDVDRLPGGPAAVTPVGIAMAALRSEMMGFLSVTVDDQPVRLLDTGGVTVGDALVAAGYQVRQLYGIPGPGMTVKLNDSIKAIKGQLGAPAPIRVNEEKADLTTRISEGDAIVVGKPTAGKPASATVGDLVRQMPPFRIIWEGKPMVVPPKLQVNGRRATMDTELADKDVVKVEFPSCLGDLLQFVGQSATQGHLTKSLRFRLNGRELERTLDGEEHYLLNGKPVGPDALITPGCRIERRKGGVLHVRDVLEEQAVAAPVGRISVQVNGSVVEMEKRGSACSIEETRIWIDGRPGTLDDVVYEGCSIRTECSEPGPENGQFILSDLFRYVELDLQEGAGALQIWIDGEPAGFCSPLTDGAEIELAYKNGERVRLRRCAKIDGDPSD